MKYIALAFLLVALPIKAEVLEVPVMCESTDKVLTVVKEEYGEELIFMSEGVAQGNQSPLYSSLWVNPQSRSWSFLVVNKDSGVTCIFAGGKTFQIYELGESI